MSKLNKVGASLTNLLAIIGICIFINVIALYFYGSIDLTEEKRFTLADSTESMLKDLDAPIYVKVLLDGKLPANMKRLRQATIDLLGDFNDLNSSIEYEILDPNDGTPEEVNGTIRILAEEGIVPTEISLRDNNEFVKKYIYPYAQVYLGSRKYDINLLESIKTGASADEALQNSIQKLEYKFSTAINRLTTEKQKTVIFLSGHGELAEENTARLETELQRFYNSGRITLDSVPNIPSQADVVVVAKPKFAFSDKDLFKIDQYIMNGGNVIWLVDKMEASLDSIDKNRMFVPPLYDTNLDDLFFKYGVRINPDLALDIECTRVGQVVGMKGDKVQSKLLPWYYHPLVASKSNHQIVNGIDRVNLYFTSTIDTLDTYKVLPEPIKKTVLLSTSPYSRYQISPMRLTFEISRYEPDLDKFNKGNLPLAVMAEGKFESFFKNRVKASMKETLKEIGMEFKEISLGSKQLFVGDGDFIRNLYNPDDNKLSPIGFNLYENRAFEGNRDFILNAIEYMTDDRGISFARSKEISMRSLDMIKVKQEKSFWQWLNIGLPVLIVIFLGFIFQYIRKRKYT